MFSEKNCFQHTCGDCGCETGDGVAVVVAVDICVGETLPATLTGTGAVVDGDVGDGVFPPVTEVAAGCMAGFVSSVCFDITTVVVFCILSWSWCSDGDLGGTEVNASAALTISKTFK